MRTIKFRGKCPLLGGKFVFGFYVEDEIGKSYIEPVGDMKPHRVESKSVGQFTGLLDKNGKEIYEGDIVKDIFERILLIDFRKGSLCFRAISETNFYYANFSDWILNEEDSDNINTMMVTIIGNIHENPDLLSPAKAQP